MSTQPDTPAGSPSEAAEAVKLPAIGLMVAAGIGLPLQALSLVMNLMGTGINAAAAQDGPEAMANMLGGTVGIVSNGVAIILAVVVFMGALKMKNLESHGFAMAAAILAAIPCLSPCCIIGLPVGIWAVVVLLKPEVKSAFS